MAKKMYFNCTDWVKGKGKTKPISWEAKSNALAYISDILRHMEEGKVTKLEVYYSDKKPE